MATPTSSRASTPNRRKSSASRSKATKLADWSGYEISESKWLPLDVNIRSVSTIISNLGLRHANVSADERALDVVDASNIIGFVCKTQKSIDFSEKADYHKDWSLIPVKIENSALTISILNLCAVHGKYHDITYGYMLEKYIRDSVKDNAMLLNSVYAVTPVPFAHNIAARDFPSTKANQHVYVFVQLADTLALIGNDGHLYRFEQSSLAGKDFVKFAKDTWKCEVFVVSEDPFKNLHRRLSEKKSELSRLVSGEDMNKTNPHLDDSLAYEELKEISALSEQLDEAEDFPLLIDYGANKVEKQPARPSTSKKDQIHRLEQQILDLRREIEKMRGIFPHIYWPSMSDVDLYGSKEYLKFYAHYKKIVHVATPKLLKSYMFAPIRTPKTAEKGRRRRLTDADSKAPPTSSNATPKRRRSSRTALREQNEA